MKIVGGTSTPCNSFQSFILPAATGSIALSVERCSFHVFGLVIAPSSYTIALLPLLAAVVTAISANLLSMICGLIMSRMNPLPQTLRPLGNNVRAVNGYKPWSYTYALCSRKTPLVETYTQCTPSIVPLALAKHSDGSFPSASFSSAISRNSCLSSSVIILGSPRYQYSNNPAVCD
ncbi:hypothetical protein D3C73_1054800 [compost metagenome]